MDSFVARGHEIITDAMRRCKESEAQTHRSTAVSAHVESCLRQLWSHMNSPPAVEAIAPLPVAPLPPLQAAADPQQVLPAQFDPQAPLAAFVLDPVA